MKRKSLTVFAISFAILLLANSMNSYSKIFINELLANGVNDPDSEWIEIFSNEPFEFALNNWNISESSSRNFTINAVIPPKGFIILAGDINFFNATYPFAYRHGITIINITKSGFNLADDEGSVMLYDSSGNLADRLDYAQQSGKKFENVSIGKYPDGEDVKQNFTTLTPGAKNDASPPIVNKWIFPATNGTKINSSVNITINITDDASAVDSAKIRFNNSNYSMAGNGDVWSFAYNTSLIKDGFYTITAYFNDSYGKSGDSTFNILIANSPLIASFHPLLLSQTLEENSTLNFHINISDPDGNLQGITWFIDGIINASNTTAFFYTPGFSDNGTHFINATAIDSLMNQASIMWRIKVININRPPILGPIANKKISRNSNIFFNLSASDSDNDTLEFFSNNTGIFISKLNNSLAAASWKPTNLDLGLNVVNFTVSDGILADSKLAVIEVNYTDNFPPLILSSPKTSGVKNERYSYTANAADSDGDILKFSLISNLSDISIDAFTGEINFAPSQTGFFEVNISVTDFIGTASQSYNLTIMKGGGLKISDVKVKLNGKSTRSAINNTRVSRNAEPNSSIEFKIKVENDLPKDDNIKIENVRLRVTLAGIDDGSDIEGESGDFNLLPGGDKTTTLNFHIPFNVDEGVYVALIEADGEDELGNNYESHNEIGIEVRKEKHDLRFLDFKLNPDSVKCGRDINAKYVVIDAGEEDEDNAVVEIKNAALGIDFSRNGISLVSGTKDNTFSDTARLIVREDAEKGTYQLTANVYTDDGRLRDTGMVYLKVQTCVKTKTESVREGVLIKAGGPANENIPGVFAQTTENEAGQIAPYEYFNDNDKLNLLVLSSLVFIGFFVAAALALFV